MTWARIDDGMWCHPKVLIAGHEAIGVWVRALAWSCQQLTDGVIPRAAMAMLCADQGPWERLRDAGLLSFSRNGDATLHDFLAYNPSRSEVVARREQAQIRARKGAEGRWKTEPKSSTYAPKHADKQPRKHPASTHASRSSAAIRTCTRPDPDPRSTSKEVLPFICSPTNPDPEPGSTAGASSVETTTASGGKQANRSKPKTIKRVIPDQWAPNEEHLRIAVEELGHNSDWLDSQATLLRDWASAKGARYVDWDAMFRGWLRRANGAPAPASAIRPPSRGGPVQTVLPPFRPGDEPREY